MKKSHFNILWLIILLIVLVGLSLADLCIGSSQNVTLDIISNLRLPHVICAIIAGAGLALVGCILQSSLVNPLASASTIGISQGASAGACIAIVCLGGSSIALGFASIGATIILSFIFALIPAAVIFALTSFKNLSSTSTILCGIAMSIFFTGLIALIEYFADSDKVADVVFWTFGSLRNIGWTGLIIMGVICALTLIFAWLNSLNFNAYESGDEVAHSVGLSVTKSRAINLIVSSVCAGAITAFCGTINFIGLIAPHIMRKLVGANYRVLVPASALCGACLLLIADIISSVAISGAILPIGAITSFIGAPIFIVVLLREKM